MVTFAIANSIFVAFVVYLIEYERFKENIILCIIVVILAIQMSVMAIFPFLAKEIGKLKLLVAFLLQAVVLIFLFAGIYRGYGLIGNNGNIINEPLTALYFSIVTWTTLGYGDYQPREEIQLIAAFQSILGYLFLGMIVSILASMLNDSKRKEDIDQREEE